MNKKVLRTAATAGILAGALCIGGMMAYFTDADDATNTFTVGKVSIDLTEPDWDPDIPPVVPGQTVEKNPTITNDGVNDEFVFLKVSVPYRNIVTVNADGTKNEASDAQLFTYEVNDGWTMISEEKDTENSVNTYVYAYTGNDQAAMQAIVKDESTEALFEQVTFVNAAEGQGLEETVQSIQIDAYSIQSSFLGESADETSPEEVWSILSNQRSL